MKKLRIYVAAPYNPVNLDPHGAVQQAQRNVDRVIEAANYIHDIGHYAFVPHLSHYLHIHYSCKKDRGVWYYDYDNTFLDLWANAFLYLMSSFGADREWERAYKNKIPIYRNLGDIPIADEYKEEKAQTIMHNRIGIGLTETYSNKLRIEIRRNIINESETGLTGTNNNRY